MGVPVPRAQCGAPVRRHRRARPQYGPGQPAAAASARDLASRPRRASAHERPTVGATSRRVASSPSICPGGMGRRLPLHSWGWRGQIDDLARMPSILRAARPWLRIDVERVYAVGGSMGGQETLLLVGRHPRLLAGAVAFDSVTDFKLRYDQFARIAKGTNAPGARPHRGGRHASNPLACLRPPQPDELDQRRSRESGVPLQVWWSDADEIVVDQGTQSQRFFEELHESATPRPGREGDRLMEPHRGELRPAAAPGRGRLARARSPTIADTVPNLDAVGDP